ncbi:MAG: imidazolonepropionase, partial [Deltaproteobacteria bacterium]
GAALAVAGEKVAWCGPQAELEQYVDASGAEKIDACNCTVMPGMIDCHTHLVFAGSRAAEFNKRLCGISYEKILEEGGGIHATVSATREATEEILTAIAVERLDAFLRHGVTCIEAKSGYGLELETELKILRVAREAGNSHPVEVVNTFLGAHTVPAEYKTDRAGYLRLVTEKMIPAVAEQGLAEFCDVFCDRGAFDVAEARQVLEAGIRHGMRPKIHAEQLSRTGACELAAELRAVSADHLEFADEEAAAKLARAGCVAVLLPGATYFIGRDDYAKGRLLAEAGCKIAVSTDFNPGSCYTENLPLMLNMACLKNGLYPREVLVGVTRHAAAAIGRPELGRLTAGSQADAVILDTTDYRNLIYHFGHDMTAMVLKKGRPVYTNPSSRLCRRTSSRSATALSPSA